MSRWLLRLGLAVLLGMVLSRADAQEVVATPQPIQPVVHEMSLPAVSATPSTGCTSCQQNPPNPLEQGNWLTRQIHGCMWSHGVGCSANHNSNGCTSCYARWVFVFGSCRQFFGEPCIPPQPDTYPARVPIVTPQYGGAGGLPAPDCHWCPTR
jgi:hypothetical protein